jgi:hypothetical protein
MKANRQLIHDDKGQMQMIGAAVGLFITLMICILVYYNIAGSIDTNTIDAKFGLTINATGVRNGSSPVYNTTIGINNQAATFFTIAPIIGVVIVAVVVISYVKQIG